MPFEIAAQCEKRNKSFAIATITGATGRTPRKDGRMVVLPDGRCFGTVGGGAGEREVARLAIEAMKEGRGRFVQIKIKESGMIDVFIDVPVRGRKAILFGTGHIATTLADVLFRIGFEITFVDERARDRGFVCPDNMALESGFDIKAVDSKTAVVFSNPEDRDKYIHEVLKSDCAYIGVLSSKTRQRIDNDRIHQPIGLDIGAETPEEIAISIAAQILAVLNGKAV